MKGISIMRKNLYRTLSISLISMLLLSFGGNALAITTYADVAQNVHIGGCESVYDAAGIPLGSRHFSSGQMRTGRRSNSIFLGSQNANNIVGTIITEGWFEVNDRGHLLGFGPEYMRVVRGPQAFVIDPSIWIVFMGRPHPNIAPHTGQLRIRAEFLSPLDRHTIDHLYNFHGHNGRFDFQVF